MKVLVTGGTGMLGSELLRGLAEMGHEGTALDRKVFLAAGRKEQSSMLSEHEIIIHAAANTNVEQCEVDPEICYFDNTFLTEKLFWHAHRGQKKFVFISSTGIYGRGKSEPHHEYDSVQPTTVHHRSKLLSEEVVLSCPNTLVIRTGWLFGGQLSNKKNFIANRINEIRASTGFISANFVQIGSPTYVVDCARRLLELTLDDCEGIYNVVNEGVASRFDYVKKIAELSGSPIEVRPIESSAFNRRADVSENEAALSYRMRYEGRLPLRPWQDALSEYMRYAGLLGCLSA
ncbi:SDR family oxidoreductase [Comamonas odontotermitis]|uniref:SDR family oxidoreductase n=1 Tax=Comamonas odontotermitis TaxID=379895 RepID=UPI00366B2BA5